ncbi:ester cyclase [Spirosoma arcticum]
MDKAERNKKVILEYALMMSVGPKTEEKIRRYSSQQSYIDGVLMYEAGFPGYTIFIEDLTAEGDDVIVHGIFRGEHKGEIFGLPPTHRAVEYPMMVKYRIVDDKIVDAWPMSDQMLLFEQLGLLNRPG